MGSPNASPFASSSKCPTGAPAAASWRQVYPVASPSATPSASSSASVAVGPFASGTTDVRTNSAASWTGHSFSLGRSFCRSQRSSIAVTQCRSHHQASVGPNAKSPVAPSSPFGGLPLRWDRRMAARPTFTAAPSSAPVAGPGAVCHVHRLYRPLWNLILLPYPSTLQFPARSLFFGWRPHRLLRRVLDSRFSLCSSCPRTVARRCWRCRPKPWRYITLKEQCKS